jgi:hypothetical protein
LTRVSFAFFSHLVSFLNIKAIHERTFVFTQVVSFQRVTLESIFLFSWIPVSSTGMTEKGDTGMTGGEVI